MKEYIERSAAVKAAQDGADEWDGGFNRNRDAYIEAAIDKVPAADVQEVRHSSCAKTLRESIPLEEFRLRVEQLLRQAISDDYVGIFLDRDCERDYTVFDWIKYDVETTSGWKTDGVYNDDDIKLAVGRVLDEYFFPCKPSFL